MASLGTIPSAVAQQRILRAARPEGLNPLEALIQGFQEGQAIQNLPETLALQQQVQQDQALSRQLNIALQQQKLQELRNPNLALAREIEKAMITRQINQPGAVITPLETGVGTEIVQTPGALTPTQQAALEIGGAQPTVRAGAPIQPVLSRGVPTGFGTQVRPETQKPIEVGGSLVVQDPTTGEYKSVFTSPTKAASLGTPQFVRSITNPKDIRLIPVDASGLPPEGYEFLKTTEKGMTPGQIITSKKEVRAVYDDLPAKIDYFGKGQIRGSNQLKSDLDAILKPIGGDFNKLSAQGLKSFIFRANKLNDPTSATLLAEASQIADRAGIGDRFTAYIENIKSGKDVPISVAKDIYNIISQVEATHRERLIDSLVPLKEDLDALDTRFTSIGVPPDIQREIERRIANPQVQSPVATPGINPNAPSPVRSGPLKIGRFTVTPR